MIHSERSLLSKPPANYTPTHKKEKKYKIIPIKNLGSDASMVFIFK